MSDKDNVNGNDNAADKNIQAQNNDNGNGNDNAGHMIPKSRFDQVVNQRKAAEIALDEIASELVEEIPEDMRDIIPDLPPADKIKWLRTATKKNLFGKQAQTNGPDSKRPGGKQPTELENMNPTAMMASGYNKS